MGFRQSDQRIYNNMIHEGTFAKWQNDDWYAALSPLQNIGFSWNPATMKMQKQGPMMATASTPWCHHRVAIGKKCHMDHHVMFNTWGIIPERCLECWKVCITLNSFDELMQMETLQSHMDLPSKCGIELRDYTPKHYGAYYYTNSFDEGRDRYKEVRKAIDDNIELTDKDKPVGVILKRACTEYEMILGPSPYWTITDEQRQFCNMVENMVDSGANHEQPEMFKKHVRLTWALWAHSNGDMTYQKYNNGKSLFPDYVSYHEGPRDDYRVDLAVARASKFGIPAETTGKFLDMGIRLAEEEGISPAGMPIMAGANGNNPLKWGKLLKTVPEETKGEHDELT